MKPVPKNRDLCFLYRLSRWPTARTMNTILSFLYKVKCLKPNINKVARWVKTSNPDGLTLALRYGKYDVRKAAIEGITSLKHSQSIPLLEEFIDDPVQSVSESAMSGLTFLTDGAKSVVYENIK